LALRLSILLSWVALAAPAPRAPRVIEVDVDSIVHPVTVEIVSRAFEQAQQQHYDLVLIRLNTPGGLMDAMRETIQKIVASPVPVVTYVAPSGGRAASAGFFLLEAGDVAAMAPGTNTGAAHPVLIGTEMDPIMKQKVENDAAASLRSLTAKRGRNSDLAQKAVLESKSFTEKEALENHLIELIAASEQDLIRQLDGREITRFDGRKETLHLRGFELVHYEKNLRQRVLSAISNPNIALIILVLGALGIYAEFSSPGLIFPGVAGAILVLLGLSALSMLPINWLGAALLILAFHTWSSNRWPSFALSIGIGISGVFFALFASSAKLAKFYPWLLPINTRDPALKSLALILGITGGIIISIVGCWEVTRRDVL